MARHDGLITNAEAAAAIEPHRLLVWATGQGTADGQVKQAANDDAAIVGVADQGGAAKGARLDIHQGGVVEVKYGGAVSRGDALTSNADGKAVKTTTDGAYCIGIAQTTGVADDIGSVLFAPFRY